jgi:hypothetical protein
MSSLVPFFVDIDIETFVGIHPTFLSSSFYNLQIFFFLCFLFFFDVMRIHLVDQSSFIIVVVCSCYLSFYLSFFHIAFRLLLPCLSCFLFFLLLVVLHCSLASPLRFCVVATECRFCYLLSYFPVVLHFCRWSYFLTSAGHVVVIDIIFVATSNLFSFCCLSLWLIVIVILSLLFWLMDVVFDIENLTSVNAKLHCFY